ncbi:hypothetical protein Tsubulata_038520 [Turnera subulata]|uniref:Uncharacterized protein n=1 Tax=Turnera subulata TaxID=218843 RepID=A0A9Q0FNN1_9ROSI|nr:hypothetical protein Tsubulata_038520 [Turnera subulata]
MVLKKAGWLYCDTKGQSRTPKMPHFDWTGYFSKDLFIWTKSLIRPYLISPKCFVPAHIELPDWAVAIKTPEQIKRMRETCRIAREVLDAAARVIRPGVTTDEINRVAYEATAFSWFLCASSVVSVILGWALYPSDLNYYFFPKSCCT